MEKEKGISARDMISTITKRAEDCRQKGVNSAGAQIDINQRTASSTLGP